MLSHNHLLLRIISISITIVVIIITIVDVILQLGFASYSSDNQDARVVSWKAGGIEMEAVPIVAGAATSPGGERWTRVFKVTRGSRWDGKNVPIVQGGATSPRGATKVV